MQNIKNLMQQIRFAQNPVYALNQMATSNPMLKQAVEYIKQNGGDARTACYNLAREKGIDPTAILNQLR